MFLLKIAAGTTIALLLICVALGDAKNSHFSLKYNTLDCFANALYISNLNCSISQPEPNRVSFDINFLQKVFDFEGQITIYLFNTRQQEYRKTLDLEFDVCNLLDGGWPNKLANAVANSFFESTQRKRECPFYGHYNFHNINFVNNLPTIMPEIQFKTVSKFFKHNKRLLINATATGNIYRKTN